MLKVTHRTVAPFAAGALLALCTPAIAMTAESEAAFEAEISHAKSKMMGHSARALEHARRAAKAAAGETARAKKAKLTARWLEAEALMRLNRAGEASQIIDKAVAETAESFSGSKLHADLLRSQGSLNARRGKFGAALFSFEEAKNAYAALGEDRSRAMALQNIGSVYSAARDFEQALNFFRQANDIFPSDPALSLAAHNNMGNALKGLGRYEEAASHFGKAIEAAKARKSPSLEARILTNIASVQALGGSTTEAEKTAATAIGLAKEHAPGWARFVEGVFAQIALSRGDLDEAKSHIERAFTGEDPAKTGAHFREFHEAAVEIFTLSDEPANADLHRGALDRLDAKVAKLGD